MTKTKIRPEVLLMWKFFQMILTLEDKEFDTFMEGLRSFRKIARVPNTKEANGQS